MSAVTMARGGVPTPDRSLAQRLDALRNANEIRSRRAELKRDMKAGRVTAIEILAAPPEWALTMKVWDVLIAIPKLGKVKVAKTLQAVEASPSKTLGGMTTRQRVELIDLLRARG